MWMLFLFKLFPKSAWVQKVKNHLRKDSEATLDVTLVSGCCETGCEEPWESSQPLPHGRGQGSFTTGLEGRVSFRMLS